MVDRFTFHRSYFDAIKNLEDTQRLAMYDTIMRYAFEETPPEDLPPLLHTCFLLMRPSINRGKG